MEEAIYNITLKGYTVLFHPEFEVKAQIKVSVAKQGNSTHSHIRTPIEEPFTWDKVLDELVNKHKRLYP